MHVNAVCSLSTTNLAKYLCIINHHIHPKHFGQVLPCFERQTVGNGGQACGPNTASVALTSGHHRKSLGGSQKKHRPATAAAAAAADATEEHHANGAAAECSLQEEVPLRASYNRGLDNVCLHLEGATPDEDAGHESNGFDMEQLKLPIGAQFLERAEHNLHRMGAELI
jgi:hypothetical protein